jgi:hypothetical protein
MVNIGGTCSMCEGNAIMWSTHAVRIQFISQVIGGLKVF